MRFKNQYILLLFLALCTFCAKAQKLDSLLKVLDNYKKEDTVKVDLLNKISTKYCRSNPALGKEYADKAIRSAKNLNDKRGLSYAYLIKGANEFILSNYEDALRNYDTALILCRETKNKMREGSVLDNIGNVKMFQSEFTKALDCYQKSFAIYKEIGAESKISIPLGNMASIYNQLSDYPRALDYYQQSLAIDERIGTQTDIALNLHNIGVLYYNLSDFPKALENFQKAKAIHEKNDDQMNLAYSVGSIANAYSRLGDSAKALEFYNASLKIDEKLGNKNVLANTLNNMGSFYQSSNDYTKAKEYHRRALAINQSIGSWSGVDESLFNIGTDYINEKNYAQAFDYMQRSKKMADSLGLPNRQRDALLELSNIYEALGKYDSAYNSYKKYVLARDSIINNEKDKRITRLEIQYEFNKKEDSLSLQQQVTDEKLKQQILLAKQQQQQLELKKKELELTNKEKDLQKLAYLKTQADLQNEQLEKQKGDKQLTIAQKEKDLQLSQVKNLSQRQALSKLQLREQWLYSIGILILLGIAASWFIYRNRLKQVELKIELAKEKEEQEKKEAEFQRSLADVSLTALRSQMNPHFIFNCLNSIKLYTTQNDTIAASEYLTKFSKLIRLVMENSRNDRISLAAELNALRLYMEMEAMRFKEKLQYNIKVEEDVETDYIEIPPLLLQPYVENAIWHGLMHKEEGGKININAAMHKEESLLEINITDDGIGRAKSAELRSKTATRHKSYGMKVTSERIALINQIYKTGANVSIHDLMRDGQSAGTLVTILIPV